MRRRSYAQDQTLAIRRECAARSNFKFIRRALNLDAEVRPHPLFAFRRKIANDVAEHSVLAVVFGFEAFDNARKFLRRLVRKGVSQLLCGDMFRAKKQIRRAAVLILADGA